jgi:hypothetical protein
MVPLLRSLGDLDPDFLPVDIKRNFREALRMGNGNPD